MFWVLQDDLFQENGREVLISTLERFHIPYQIVKIVPFVHELVPEITQTENVITNGSILLSQIARKRGWTPGGFLNDNFDYRVWFPIFRPFLLNRDAIFTTVGDAPVIREDVFVRPVLDSKSFDGTVMTADKFERWRLEVMEGQSNFVKPETEIILSSPKKIGQEHRHFIVDGKVITSSRYKLNHRVNFAEGADPHVIEFVQRMIEIWTPAQAFVLDTYLTEDEVGIVELGCIANAGFYKADVQKLVMALNSLEQQ